MLHRSCECRSCVAAAGAEGQQRRCRRGEQAWRRASVAAQSRGYAALCCSSMRHHVTGGASRPPRGSQQAAAAAPQRSAAPLFETHVRDWGCRASWTQICRQTQCRSSSRRQSCGNASNGAGRLARSSGALAAAAAAAVAAPAALVCCDSRKPRRCTITSRVRSRPCPARGPTRSAFPGLGGSRSPPPAHSWLPPHPRCRSAACPQPRDRPGGARTATRAGVNGSREAGALPPIPDAHEAGGASWQSIGGLEKATHVAGDPRNWAQRAPPACRPPTALVTPNPTAARLPDTHKPSAPQTDPRLCAAMHAMAALTAPPAPTHTRTQCSSGPRAPLRPGAVFRRALRLPSPPPGATTSAGSKDVDEEQVGGGRVGLQ